MGNLVSMCRVHHIDVLEALCNLQVLRQAEFGLDDYKAVDTAVGIVLDVLDDTGQFFHSLGETEGDIEGVGLLRDEPRALQMVNDICATAEVGETYLGKVVRIVDFGAFVNFFGKRDGLVHVSQIENRRLNHPSDVLKEGQEVFVKLLGFDDRGKVRLAMKMVDQETGEEMKKEEAAEG